MEEKSGTVTIAPEVLRTVARLIALATPGVARLEGNWRRDAGRFPGNKGANDGVGIAVEQDAVTVNLYVVAERDTNLLKLGQTLQTEITRAIQEMVGMDVRAVNIYIQDIELPLSN